MVKAQKKKKKKKAKKEKRGKQAKQAKQQAKQAKRKAGKAAAKAAAWSTAHERAVLGEWQKDWNKEYGFNVKAQKLFIIDTPPPYPSGEPWHIGAVAHYSQIDMIARTARALGFSVLFPACVDRNGLPVEHYTEKKHRVKGYELPRERFVQLCSTSLDELEAEMMQIMRNIGLSADFEHRYRTDSLEYRSLTQSTFIELWNKGLIYEATRPNNYCPGCRTTIADAEVVYEEKPTELVYITFKSEGKPFVIATTRPELLCACQAVLVNPKDAKRKDLIGKKAIVPIYNKEVEIKAHSSVDPEFGSGIVMTCSYGDYTDVLIFRELGLQEIKAVSKEGTLTEVADPYQGLSIKKARQRIIADLEAQGLLEKKQHIMHRTPVCERCKAEVEIIAMPELYLKQLAFLDPLKIIARKLRFHPELHRRALLDWIEAISLDWPISRRRFYGTEIPIWYCKKCGKAHLPKADWSSYWQPWKKGPTPFERCSCGSKEFIGETRTFDTWMDSGITTLFITKFKRDQAFFTKTFPCTIRPQGKDIIRTWLYYTLLRCYQLTGKPAFKRVWITGMGLDEKGQVMHKSKGNVIDPVPLIERYGSDAFRFWAASEATLGSDFRCSEQRIVGASKFVNKLWNISNFINQFPRKPKPKKLAALDGWILTELSKTVKESLDGYKEFNFFTPSNVCRRFLWTIFADHYIELVKSRAYAGDASALFTLHKCLASALILLAPICPFICYSVYKRAYGRSINQEQFKALPRAALKQAFSVAELQALNSAIWKAKKDRGLSLKAEIKKALIPKQFKPIESDLKACHSIKEAQFADVKKAKLSL